MHRAPYPILRRPLQTLSGSTQRSSTSAISSASASKAGSVLLSTHRWLVKPITLRCATFEGPSHVRKTRNRRSGALGHDSSLDSSFDFVADCSMAYTDRALTVLESNAAHQAANYVQSALHTAGTRFTAAVLTGTQGTWSEFATAKQFWQARARRRPRGARQQVEHDGGISQRGHRAPRGRDTATRRPSPTRSSTAATRRNT